MDVPPSTRRVAVVVVAGVGDSARSDAARRVGLGLTDAGFDAPSQHAEWYRASDPADEEPIGDLQPLQRLTTRKDGVEVDVYEFWWADLSRFPAALRSFLAAFVGLFLALPSIGRTALRDDGPIGKKPQPRPSGKPIALLDFHLLGFLAWLVAVPVVVVSAAVVVAVGAVAVAVAVRDSSSWIGAIALGGYAIVLAAVGLALLHHYGEQSGRRPAFGIGVIAVAGSAAVCAWRLYERHGHGPEWVPLAFADTLTVLVAYPLRIVWLAVLAAAFGITAVLAVQLLLARKKRRERRARTVSALVTVAFAPFGIATLMAIFAAAVGAVVRGIGESATWTSATGTPKCLVYPDDWTLTSCTPPLNAWEFGSGLLADVVYALGSAAIVGAVALALFAVAAAIAFVRTKSKDRIGGQAARITRQLGVIDARWTSLVLLLVVAAAAYAAAAGWLPFLPFPVHPSRLDDAWGPTVAAILGGGVTTLLLAARLMGLSPTGLAMGGRAPGALRALLDKPYDVSTFLREPLGWKRVGHGVGQRIPREKMLDRFELLMRHLARRRYDRVVFAAHSQGTILTTALLAETDATALPLPPEVSLLTFGCPLRQLYFERFPSQFAWVGTLADPEARASFVRRVNGTWVNVAAAGDPIGRTVFGGSPMPWVAEGRQELPGAPKLVDVQLGRGGHSSYWKSRALYLELKRLIEEPLAPAAPTAPGAHRPQDVAAGV